VFTSCVDEIYKPSVINYVKKTTPPITLVLENFYYYFNCRGKENAQPFPNPVVARKGQLHKGTHELWEKRHTYPQLLDAGWHFSYLGGIDAIRTKLESFSHSEYDTPYYKDPQRLAEKMMKGHDLFDRSGYEFEFVDIDGNFPEHLQRNQDRYSHLIMQV
jgi:beta-1,4-mannosyl-glycoprotein beta-1,4-N-acetylglucosaminyltransferase